MVRVGKEVKGHTQRPHRHPECRAITSPPPPFAFCGVGARPNVVVGLKVRKGITFLFACVAFFDSAFRKVAEPWSPMCALQLALLACWRFIFGWVGWLLVACFVGCWIWLAG